MTDAQRPDIDFDRALLDPASAFASPEMLAAHESLTVDQKIELLRRWEYDASETSVATEEGMPGGDGDLLRRILLALSRLAGGLDVEQVGPTKHHGLPRPETKRD